jgi:hypothetical protein
MGNDGEEQWNYKIKVKRLVAGDCNPPKLWIDSSLMQLLEDEHGLSRPLY